MTPQTQMTQPPITPEEKFTLAIEKLRQEMEARFQSLERRVPNNRVAIAVFSGDMDKVLAAFVIANGALAMDMEVSMFFTFWGLAAIKKNTRLSGKGFRQGILSMMIPANSSRLPTSKLNMLGMGPTMMKGLMRDKNISSLEELRNLAQEMDARFISCAMSMDVMGVQADEFIPGVELGGVATFMEVALNARATLFI
ncbi:MAG: DsrE/DsrF/DrsH-like family protein [Magnetococcales bacterium]|nr:DsrE/DsrF/DrsH-like family protein [Magnetococcales bacterium]